MSFILRSSSFMDGGEIPMKYTGDGEDLSPPLEWSNIPRATKEFVLTCTDHDLRMPKVWVHWIIYKIPAHILALPEGVEKIESLPGPVGLYQGENSWHKIGYSGPLPRPSHGWHEYHFKLYALGTELDLKSGATMDELIEAINGHTRGQVELIGRYRRKEIEVTVDP